MSNILKIFFLKEEIHSLELDFISGKKITLNLELSLSITEELKISSKNEWIEIEQKEPSTLTISLLPSSQEDSLQGEIFITSSSGELIKKLPVLLNKRNEQSATPHPSQQTSKIIDKSEHFCTQCGTPVPDKRPLCSDCRRKKEELDKQDEAAEEEEKLRQIKGKVRKLSIPLGISVFLLIIALILVNKHITEEKHGFGTLLITSNPSGADVVSLDNKFADGTTPLKREGLATGVYKFSVSKENCSGRNEITSIEIKNKKTSEYHALLSKKGSLSLDSIPQGASIRIDGVPFDQKTPAEIKDIDVGERQVTFIFEDSSTKEVKASVKWGEKTKIYAFYDDKKAGLKLKIPDGVKIKIDGKISGISPLPLILLSPGKHTITLSSPAIMPWSTKIILTKGDIATLTPNITYMGELAIKADRDAELYVNNEYMGQLPLTLYTTPNKKIKLTAVAYDGYEWSKSITMKEGQFRRISIDIPYTPQGYGYNTGEMVYSASANIPSASYTPEPTTDFSEFRVEKRFPHSQWRKQDQIINDIDLDGESEMIIAFKNITEKTDKGYKIHLFIIKKHHEHFFDIIPLKNPKINAIGTGELISLDIIKSDKYGYREILFSCGTTSGGFNSSGSFTIYKNKAYAPVFNDSK